MGGNVEKLLTELRFVRCGSYLRKTKTKHPSGAFMDLLCYRSHLDPQYMWYKHNQADFDLYTAFAKIGADALNLQGLTFDNGQFCGWPFFNPKNRGRLLQQTDGAYVQRVEKDFEDTNTMDQKYTWLSAFAATYYKSIQ